MALKQGDYCSTAKNMFGYIFRGNLSNSFLKILDIFDMSFYLWKSYSCYEEHLLLNFFICINDYVHFSQLIQYELHY